MIELVFFHIYIGSYVKIISISDDALILSLLAAFAEVTSHLLCYFKIASLQNKLVRINSWCCNGFPRRLSVKLLMIHFLLMRMRRICV